MSQDIRSHRGTKIFKYLDPLPLETIEEKLREYGKIVRREPDREFRGEKTTINSPFIGNLELLPEIGLFGAVQYNKQEREKNSDDIFIKKIPFDFIFTEEPRMLIIHGSRTLMDAVKEGLERALHYNNDVNEPKKDSSGNFPDPFFTSIGFHSDDGKYIVKKIVKAIENANNRNILFDPHFQQLGENRDSRGGECFWRRDGVSAFQDERFCYLFQKCGYWEPEITLYSAGGITESGLTRITINRDFSFTFPKSIRKNQLDTFWTSLILPIIREDDYEAEKTECVENARSYEAKLESFQ